MTYFKKFTFMEKSLKIFFPMNDQEALPPKYLIAVEITGKGEVMNFAPLSVYNFVIYYNK